MKTSDFHFDLPRERIAQEPLADRAASRMMVMDRAMGGRHHRHASNLPEFVKQGDLLILNDTKVIPVRLFGTRTDTGGRVEVMLVEELRTGRWDAYYKASGRQKIGIRFTLADGHLQGSIVELGAGGGRVHLELEADRPIPELLALYGVMPLPPYIHRTVQDERGGLDMSRYQTVYAREPGAVAAPTAGLHLTPELMDSIRERGVEIGTVTLHVGPGTFRPVAVDDVEDHDMESERYRVPEQTAEQVRHCRQRGGRVIAVGSTSVRVLESVAQEGRVIGRGEGRTKIFIRPPYSFQVVDALLTNFHLPQSTLLMMVSAFLEQNGASSGLAVLKEAYAEAIRENYRFYSYGDCMLIL